MDDEKLMKYMFKRYEDKLVSLMGPEAYLDFTKEVAVEMFKISIELMEDGDFKDFCKSNMDRIISDSDDVCKMLDTVWYQERLNRGKDSY